MSLSHSQSDRARIVADAHDALLASARALRERAGAFERLTQELCDLIASVRGDSLAMATQITIEEEERDALLSIGDLQDKLGLSRQTLWRMRRSGELPEHILVGRKVCWRRSDLDAWMGARRGLR